MPRPSIAHVAVAALLALVVLPRAAVPLIDGDVWWHIRAGNEVIETGQVPTSDAWSIAGEGMDWTSQDWLSNVLLAVVTGGDTGGGIGATSASVLFALLAVGAVVMLWTALGARGVDGWLGRIGWLALGVIVAGPVLGVRVQVIDLVLAGAVTFLLWNHLADRRRRWLVGLPLVALAWANLHAGWVLLFLLGGAVLVGEVVDRQWRRRDAALPGRQAGELGIALAAAFVAIAINPNGIGLYAYPLETSAIAAHRDFLAEWSPPSLTSIVGQAFWAFAAVGVLPALALRWRSLRTADILVLVGLTVMAANAARFLLVAPIVAAVVALAWSGVATPSVIRHMAQPPRRNRQAAVNLALIVAVVALGVSVTWSRVGPSAQREGIAEHMPGDAVDWMLANDPGQRVFNTYSWGGYLGLRRPDLPIYIDGRSDIYGDAPIREYAETVLLERDPAELLDRQEIDHVLFNTESPFAEWLAESGDWRRVYADDLAAVWVRDES